MMTKKDPEYDLELVEQIISDYKIEHNLKTDRELISKIRNYLQQKGITDKKDIPTSVDLSRHKNGICIMNEIKRVNLEKAMGLEDKALIPPFRRQLDPSVIRNDSDLNNAFSRYLNGI